MASEKMASCNLLKMSSPGRVKAVATVMSYRGEGGRRPWKRGGGRWGRGGHRSYHRDDNDNRDDNVDGGDRGRGGGRRGGGGRPPPGLTGREIGMWYASRSRGRKNRMENEQRPVVELQGNMERKIRNLLDDINTSDNIQPQPTHSGATSMGRPSTSRVRGSHSGDVTRPHTASHSRHFGRGQRSSHAEGSDSYSHGRSGSGLNTDGLKSETSDEAWNNWQGDEGGGLIDSAGAGPSAAGRQDVEMADDAVEDSRVPSLEEVLKYSTEEIDYVFQEEMNDDLMERAELERDRGLDERLTAEAAARTNDAFCRKMMDFRKRLPSYDKRNEVMELLRTHQCLVVSGETGCGKTTQVPQFILDDYIARGDGSLCRVICTQPRRISAVSVAERVADERGQKVGDTSDVGYSIRLERQLPRKKGSIMFCTTGILLKYLESDPNLWRASHIIIDEIHERDLLSDFLMIIVKDLLPKRPDLKVILMSATLNAEQFSKYFYKCPMLNIPGFTYPVTEYWLEDVIQMTNYYPDQQKKPKFFPRGRGGRQEQELEEANLQVWARNLDSKYSQQTVQAVLDMDMTKVDIDLIHRVIHHICFNMDRDGAILVFIPGWAEIKDLNQALLKDRAFNSNNFRIIPLHSMMPTVNQREVFERPPPGVRKIIIATNIAETSITIDDVVFVVDCGKIKVKDFQPEYNLSTLDAQWVSKANARQRRGRAGRVQAGYCFHLFTSLKQTELQDYLRPEILRTRLEELCLQIKLLKLGMIEPFVNKAMQQPSLEALQLAIQTLRDLNALDSEENLLPLGYHLARMPVDPQSGKMILFGAMFGCLDPICTVAASLSFKDAFIIPLGRESEADKVRRRLSEDSNSDHIMLINAFKGWERAKSRGTASQFCWDHFMSANTLKLLKDMKKQFGDLLYDLNFVQSRDPGDASVNINSKNENLVKAVLCAGLYPNVAKITKMPNPNAKYPKPVKLHLKESSSGKIYMHPKSVNANEKTFNSSWFVYHKMMKTSQVYLYDTSMVSPYPLLFFGGRIGTAQTTVDGESRATVTVDDWISFWASPSTAQLVKDLRRQLDRILEEKITKPGATDWTSNSREGAVMRAIMELLTTEEVVQYRDMSWDRGRNARDSGRDDRDSGRDDLDSGRDAQESGRDSGRDNRYRR